MKKPNRTTMLFILIFLVGVLGFVTYINKSLENAHKVEVTDDFNEY